MDEPTKSFTFVSFASSKLNQKEGNSVFAGLLCIKLCLLV